MLPYPCSLPTCSAAFDGLPRWFAIDSVEGSGEVLTGSRHTRVFVRLTEPIGGRPTRVCSTQNGRCRMIVDRRRQA